LHPYILHFGSIFLPTFGVLAAIGLMAALFLSLRTAAIVGLSPDKLWNAGLFSILSAFVLSRLLLIVTNLHTLLSYPVLLLTVSDDVQKGRELGAAGHLTKPINRDALLRALERCCALSQQDEGQGYEQAPA